MKNLICGAVISAALWAAPAQAQVLDLSKVTCKEFVSSGTENITLVLTWMTGYYADHEAAPVIDFTKMKANAKKFGEYCQKNPDNNLVEAAEEIMED